MTVSSKKLWVYKERVRIEIKMPKEIREYQESIFFGLNTRQFICSILALGVAVGLYFCLRSVAGTEEVGWMCILGAAPFAACGFFKYHGMTAEQFAWAWIKDRLLLPKRLVFVPDNLYVSCLLPTLQRKPKPQAKKPAGEVEA